MSAVTATVRLAAALRSGAVLVSRPRGVVHVHSGRLTRSRQAVPTTERPYCGVRTRRLRVVATSIDEVPTAVQGRRFCRSCTTKLPARLGGGPGSLVSREDWLEAYRDLTVADLRLAAAWCRTVEETYQVQRLLTLVIGPKPIRPKTDEGKQLLAAYDAVLKRRQHLEAQSHTPEEIAAAAAAREAAVHNQRLLARSRRRNDAIDRAAERARSGGYVLPHERELLASG